MVFALAELLPLTPAVTAVEPPTPDQYILLTHVGPSSCSTMSCLVLPCHASLCCVCVEAVAMRHHRSRLLLRCGSLCTGTTVDASNLAESPIQAGSVSLDGFLRHADQVVGMRDIMETFHRRHRC